MNGKQKCKILKEIRAEIAKSNDIAYVTSECQHKGDCKGTCPKCEAELRYLEKELEKRQRLGKTIAVAGMAVGIALTASGCVDPFVTTDGDMQPPETMEELMGVPVPTKGDLPPEETEETFEEIEGEIVEDMLAGDLVEEPVE